MPDQTAVIRRAAAQAGREATGALDLWGRLGQAGVLAILQPAPGEQASTDLLDLLLTELDAALPMGVVLSACVQVATAIPLLASLAHDNPLAKQVLALAVGGEAVVAVAATDAAVSGSALLDATTEVLDVPGGVQLTGGKDWITNAGHCDYVLVLARHRPARHFTSFRWVLLPAGRPGMTWQPAAGALLRGAALGHLRFERVPLSQDHLVGRPGLAMAELARHLRTERLAGALWARALCRRVLLATRRRLIQRPAAGGSLWDNAAVRERFARCLVSWRSLDALCMTAERGPGGFGDAMVLKAACAQISDHILGECADLSGAEAFGEGGLACLRAQAAMFGIAGGATGTMLAGIGDHAAELLGDTA